MHYNVISRIKNNNGATAVVVGIMIAVLVGFTALAVDIGYLQMTRNELQNIADASSLAATRQLGTIYQTMDYEEQQSYVCDPSTINPIAKDIAAENWAGGKDNIIVNDVDVKIGDWDGSTFTETLDQPDAVRVIARRDASANGPITTFFAKIFGIDSLDVSNDATAALTGQSTSDPGDLEIPVGISDYWFDNNSCNDWIKFSPSNDPDSCAGWHSYDIHPSNDKTIRDILKELIESPASAVSDDFEFIGGDLSTQTFDALSTLFQIKGYDVDAEGNPILDGSGEPMSDATGTGQEVRLCKKPHSESENDCATPCSQCSPEEGCEYIFYPNDIQRNKHKWETTVVVYESGDPPDCDNPNQAKYIEGYARISITEVCGPPDKLIKGVVLCEYVDQNNSGGGGGSYGVKGSIPGLVE